MGHPGAGSGRCAACEAVPFGSVLHFWWQHAEHGGGGAWPREWCFCSAPLRSLAGGATEGDGIVCVPGHLVQRVVQKGVDEAPREMPGG